MALESLLRDRLEKKPILIMTHLVLGYPSFEKCHRLVETMARAGVDIMELQIPFSEPVADGPVIAMANQKALERGITVKDCIDFAGSVAASFDLPFLIMTYYNIAFTFGIHDFARTLAEKGLKGAIVPDLPPEEGDEYFGAMTARDLSPVLIFSPTTPLERMRSLADHGNGFIYCVARKGVTGKQTHFSQRFEQYMQMCREATRLPLAVGFGLKDKQDVDFLSGKADIAVIGSHILKMAEEKGVDYVGEFIEGLRNTGVEGPPVPVLSRIKVCSPTNPSGSIPQRR